MRASILLCSVVHLTLAATAALNPRGLSHLFRRDTITCTPRLGVGIDADDCTRAVAQFPFHASAVHGLDVAEKYHPSTLFYNNNPDTLYRLPQAYRHGTCTVYVSTNRPSVTSSWGAVGDATNNLIETCARATGQGGYSVMANGVWINVLNTANISPEVRAGWQTCVDFLRGRNNNLTWARCHEALRVDAAQVDEAFPPDAAASDESSRAAAAQ